MREGGLKERAPRPVEFFRKAWGGRRIKAFTKDHLGKLVIGQREGKSNTATPHHLLDEGSNIEQGGNADNLGPLYLNFIQENFGTGPSRPV